MRIEINPGDRQLAFILVFTAVVLAVGIAGAYTANSSSDPTGAQPAAMGHSADEIDLRPLHIDWANARVGIGEPNPGFKLHVSDRIKLDGASAGMWVESGTNDWFIGRSGSNLRFYNAGDRVTITPGGNVGIGTTSPGAKLDVAGAIYADSVTNDNSAGGLTVGGSGGANIELYGSTSPYARNAYYDAANHYFRDYDASPTRMAITSSGNVGIGTTNPSQKLDVAGQIHATGDICTDQGGGTCLSTTAGGGGAFGSWASKSKNTIYQAATDGYVMAYGYGDSTIYGYTDSTSSATTLRIKDGHVSAAGWGHYGITMPVRKNDYWKVTGDGEIVYWIPLGN